MTEPRVAYIHSFGRLLRASAEKYYPGLAERLGGIIVAADDHVTPDSIIGDLRRYRPDVIVVRGDRHDHYLAARDLGCPYVVVEHDVYSLRTGRGLARERRMLQRAAAIIYTSGEHQRHCEQRIGRLPRGLVVPLRPRTRDLAFTPLPRLPGKHLCYAGGIVTRARRRGAYGYRAYHEIMGAFMAAGWTVHLYTPSVRRTGEYADMGVVCHPPVPHRDLYLELSQYTAGLHGYARGDGVPRLATAYAETCRPNKTWDYLAAGIPTISVGGARSDRIITDGGWGIIPPDLTPETLGALTLPVIDPAVRAREVIDPDLDRAADLIASAARHRSRTTSIPGGGRRSRTTHHRRPHTPAANDGRIDCFASESHYWAHLRGVWEAIPAGRRGTLHLTRAAGDHPDASRGRPPPHQRLTLVASYGDARIAAAAGRPVALAQHGIGDDYGAGHPSHPTGFGPGKATVALYLVPHERVAAQIRAADPRAPPPEVRVVGCPWTHEMIRIRHTRPRGTAGPVVACAWHWEGRIVPEVRSAWPHYRRVLPTIARLYPGAVATAHPRILGRLAPHLGRMGFTPTGDFGDVVRGADLVCVDNSSVAYTAAAADIPVLVLNAPWYRRDRSTGLRFWGAVPGIECDRPEDLLDAIRRALRDPREARMRRRTAAAAAYAPVADPAAAAADAVCDTATRLLATRLGEEVTVR